MSDSFKAGDLVQLKSGGPLMTVEAVVGNGQIACYWFDQATVKNYIFKDVTLEKHEKATGAATA
ncbi:DUF2158 domain-containing protein [Bacterioplanes sanyensis]|uniref:DUF2158 domain-containing protein n=1 Tax=Bacterioplanes sanyensis TaxID=1249553 RepID=A0A222FPL7_9GAMM|nr:DUF2158 domain-containing protein [Bacterioplanes sanyensis]ASP40341.1 DUF2158 domain-containing protein [Bacterioplanes sanyensis]